MGCAWSQSVSPANLLSVTGKRACAADFYENDMAIDSISHRCDFDPKWIISYMAISPADAKLDQRSIQSSEGRG